MYKLNYDFGPESSARNKKVAEIAVEEAAHRFASVDAPTAPALDGEERKALSQATWAPWGGIGSAIGYETRDADFIGLVYTWIGVFAIRVTSELAGSDDDGEELWDYTFESLSPSGAYTRNGCTLRGRNAQYSFRV